MKEFSKIGNRFADMCANPHPLTRIQRVVLLIFLGFKGLQVSASGRVILAPGPEEMACSSHNALFYFFFFFMCVGIIIIYRSTCAIKEKPREGVTVILRHTGMCRSNGSLFHKKSLKYGSPFSTKISLNMDLFFQQFKNFRVFAWHFQNFLVFAMRTPKNFEKWAYISRKILKNRYLFLPKWPLKWVSVSRLEWHTHFQSKSEYPPGVGGNNTSNTVHLRSSEVKIEKLSTEEQGGQR